MAELEPGLRTSPSSQGDPLDHAASPQVRGGDGKARGEAPVKGSGTLRVRADVEAPTLISWPSLASMGCACPPDAQLSVTALKGKAQSLCKTHIGLWASGSGDGKGVGHSSPLCLLIWEGFLARETFRGRGQRWGGGRETVLDCG